MKVQKRHQGEERPPPQSKRNQFQTPMSAN
jgi:hypothetical protein